MRTGRDQREHGGAVWRGDGYPTVAGLQAGVNDQVEAELINVEAQAAVEIVNENADGVNAEEGINAEALRWQRKARRPHPREVQGEQKAAVTLRAAMRCAVPHTD